MVHRVCLVVALLFVASTASARADVFDDNPSAATLNGTVYVFARDAENRILEAHVSGGVATDWVAVPGLDAGSGPSALAYGSSLLLFARGQDGAIWWNRLSSGSWFGWRSLGGQVTSAPSAGLRYGTLTVDLAARGLNNELFYRAYLGGETWTPWQSFGGNIGSAPNVVGYYSSGSIDVFTRDVAGNVAQRYWQDGNWNGPFDLGGQIIGAPGSASARLNRLDLYARGTNNALYYHEHPAGPLKQWALVDATPLASSPAATADAPNHELIFARIGSTLQMKAASIPTADVVPAFGPWVSLGPIALPAPPPARPSRPPARGAARRSPTR